MHAGFLDPGGPSRVGQSGGPPYSLADSVLPSAFVTASASTTNAISGLILLSSHFPLSTLRDRVTPVVTQDSLPAGDLSLAGQGSNLQGSYGWFLLLHRASSISRLILAHHERTLPVVAAVYLTNYRARDVA